MNADGANFYVLFTVLDIVPETNCCCLACLCLYKYTMSIVIVFLCLVPSSTFPV